MAKNNYTEAVNTDTIRISTAEYRDLVAIRSRVEGMVDFAMNTKYASLDDCLLILGVKREKEEVNPQPQ